MKKVKSSFLIVLLLVLLSVLMYAVQLLVFDSPRDTGFFILQDIAFLPLQIAIVTVVLGRYLKSREKNERLKKISIVINAFFSEAGIDILTGLTGFNKNYDDISYGKKYCKDSISIDEESLHSAIMEAINATRGSRQQMIPYFLKQLKQSYKDYTTDKLDVDQIEQRIAELKANAMALVQESVLSNTVGANESRLKAMSDEIKGLSNIINEYQNSQGSGNNLENKINELKETLYNEPEQSDIYDDYLVKQLIDTIKVMGDEKLLITFRCGITYEQTLNRNIRKSTAA